MKYKDWLNYKDLEFKSGVLHFANLNTIELAEKFGTPIYIINEQLIRKRYKEFKKFLDSIYRRNKIYFAVKSNSNLSVLKILLSEGSNFDCSSTGEIFTCLKSDVPPDRILYTGNMFTNYDFEYSLDNGILINLDSYSQLTRLASIYEKKRKEKNVVSFRFNPEYGAGHHPHTITAGREIKFGILESQLIKAYSKAIDLGFKRFGIHQHIGSGIMNIIDFEKPSEKFLLVIEKIVESLGIQFEFIDFGGGLGIPYHPEEDPLDLNKFNEIVLTKFTGLIEKGEIGTPYLFFEPGRYISAEASIILTQINTIKDNGFKKFAGTDAGFNTLIRPAMYGSYHHIVTCKEEIKGKDFNYDIVGPICESGDVLGKARGFNELNEGDYLAILDAGAYGFTMSSPYNSRPRPGEILVNDGNLYQVRIKETFEDLLKNQVIPSHLKS